MTLKLKYFFIIILAILQLSFFKGLGFPWHHVNLLLCVSVFWIMYGGIEKNLLPIIIGAIIIDLFSGHIFGTAAFAILFTCYLINLTYLHFFTNQSLLSLLVLGVAGLFLYNFFIVVLYYFFYWINQNSYYILIDKQYWFNLIWQIVFIAIILIIFYIISNLIFAKE